MKIKGVDWMDWLHQSRTKAQEERKSKRQTLAQYLKSIEQKEDASDESGRKKLKKRSK